MASSKVMATTSTANPDLCSSFPTLLADLQNPNQLTSSTAATTTTTAATATATATMDDLLKNIYSYPTPPLLPPTDFHGGASFSREEATAKSVDEVWKEIVAGGDQRRGRMTLEDFLTKAGAMKEGDVGSVGIPVQIGAYGVDSDDKNVNDNYDNNLFHGMMMVEGAKGRQKRRILEEPPMDKATQLKQRRMIKNRESAARSRERKQAYTIELESLVTQLEEENARLLREEVEQSKERFKELMENLIPVVEKKRLPRFLRRVNSVQW